MNNNLNSDTESNDQSEEKSFAKEDEVINIHTSSFHISRAMFFSFLRGYAVIPINFIITWLISHNISDQIWGKYIYTIILINGSSIILNFFPPSLSSVIIYKVPELLVHKEQSKIKGLISYAIKTKLIISGLVSCAYMIWAIILLKNKDPEINLEGKLMFVLLFTIVITEIKTIFVNFLLSMKINSTIFYLQFFEILVLAGGYALFFQIYSSENEKVIAMSVVYLFSTFITLPFYIVWYKKRFRDIQKEDINWKYIKTTIKFGMYYSISGSLSILNQQIAYGVLEGSGNSAYNTYYNLGQNIYFQASRAVASPIAPMLSDLIQTNQKDQMVLLFKKIILLTTLFLSLIIGLLYYILESYILILYTPEYLFVVDILKYYFFIFYFNDLFSKFCTLFSITQNEKMVLYMNIVKISIFSLCYILGFKFGGFKWFIQSQIIASIITIIICFIYSNKIIAPLRISIRNIFKHFIFLCIIIIIIDYAVIDIYDLLDLNNITIWISNFLNNKLNLELATLKNVEILVKAGFLVISFLIFFISYIIIFRGFTRGDLENLSKIGIKIPFKRFFRKILRN